MATGSVSKKRGFTLIELLVVIAIIGLLSSVILSSVNSARAKARDARRMSDLRQMQKAVENYATANGSYPSTADAWWGFCATYGSHPQTGATGFIPNVAPTYIPILPVDPLPVGTDRCYLYKSDGINYMILAHMTVESFNPDSPQHALDRPAFNQQSIAVYSPGARLW